VCRHCHINKYCALVRLTTTAHCVFAEALLRRIRVGMKSVRVARKLEAKGKRGERGMRHLNCERRRFLAVLALPDDLVSDLLCGYSYLRRLVQPPGVANAGLRLWIQLGAAGAAAAVLLLAALSN
jgi:hypothetical protein